MMFTNTLVLCGLLLVICITDQLSSVTGHSLKSPSPAGREKIGGKRAGSLMKEIMNEIRDERRQQKKSINHVRSTTHRTLSAHLRQSITSEARRYDIGGLATRDNKLYVGYIVPPTVEIYDVSTFSLQRRLNITGATCIQDMASCPDCDVVFIADFCNNQIHVIDDVGQHRTQWNVDDWPNGVSVNSQSNVIVTFVSARKLREYTPSGELVREITLQSDIESPYHTIQLDNDRYVVAHVGSLHRVCIVNGNGAVVGQCYGGQRGSGVGQLNYPGHLALFGESLLVADFFNYRVLQLDLSSLTYIGELINTRNNNCMPWKMTVNEDDSRLDVAYVGNANCLIKVYNLIAD